MSYMQSRAGNERPVWLTECARAADEAASGYSQDAAPRIAFRSDHCFDVVPRGGWNRSRMVRVCVRGIFLLEGTGRTKVYGDVRNADWLEFRAKLIKAVHTHLPEGLNVRR